MINPEEALLIEAELVEKKEQETFKALNPALVVAKNQIRGTNVLHEMPPVIAARRRATMVLNAERNKWLTSPRKTSLALHSWTR